MVKVKVEMKNGTRQQLNERAGGSRCQGLYSGTKASIQAPEKIRPYFHRAPGAVPLNKVVGTPLSLASNRR